MKLFFKLSLLLLALLLPATASAYDFEVDGIYYEILGDNQVAVTFQGYDEEEPIQSYTGNVIIPETVIYEGVTYSVTSIADYAFSNCSGLTSVTIPNCVTSIGDWAFNECRDLTSVTIPNTVTEIGDGVFWGCSGLASIDIPNSVTYIGDMVFECCSGLTSVTIGNSVTGIGNRAFYGCYSLTSVNIPNSVTGIGDEAFYGCSLTSVTIPNSVSYIGSAAFCCCSMTSINIPNSVTYIGRNAFDGCTELTRIDITDIAAWCGILFDVEEELPSEMYNSIYTSNPLYYANHLYLNGSEIINLVIPNTVTSIGTNAFHGCSGLTSVDIPNSVTEIGHYAFYGCSGLTSVIIGNSVTTIGDEAFSDCSGLTSVTIPNSVTRVGQGAFCWCTSLDTLNFNAVSCAYGSLHSYANIDPFENTIISIINIGDEVQGIPTYFARGLKYLTSVDIPNSVQGIGDEAFAGCSGLTSVTIGNSVTTIGDAAFYGCSVLTSVTIPNSVTNIGTGAFRNCSGLTSVTIPNSVTRIGSYAFYGTAWYDNQPDGLVYAGKVAYKYKGAMPEGTGMIIADGTLGIAGSAFSYCRMLTSVTIPNSVTSIGENAFYDCSGLASVTIGNSVTSIGDEAFYGCNGLKSVNIPNSVTYIGSYVFYGCSGLKSITIPNSVTRIGRNAFQYCSGLNDVFSFIVDPTTVFMGSDVFYRYQNNYAERTLHVPFGTSAAYQADTRWSQYFGSIVEMGPMVATSIELDKSSARMETGEKLQLTAELKPIEAIYNEVLWGSSNPAVAMVSNNGLVTAVNVGTATITAMTTDGSNLSASCVVIVYTEMNGDVDGSGLVNISDVTALIDYLLNGDASAIVLSNADSDGNGAVNISDVTALIDYLLTGHWPEP